MARWSCSPRSTTHRPPNGWVPVPSSISVPLCPGQLDPTIHKDTLHALDELNDAQELKLDPQATVVLH